MLCGLAHPHTKTNIFKINIFDLFFFSAKCINLIFNGDHATVEEETLDSIEVTLLRRIMQGQK